MSQDILLFASDGKANFQPAGEICVEEMSLTATLRHSFDLYRIGFIPPPHMIPPFLLCCSQTISNRSPLPHCPLVYLCRISSPSRPMAQIISPAEPEIREIHLDVWPWQKTTITTVRGLRLLKRFCWQLLSYIYCIMFSTLLQCPASYLISSKTGSKLNPVLAINAVHNWFFFGATTGNKSFIQACGWRPRLMYMVDYFQIKHQYVFVIMAWSAS